MSTPRRPRLAAGRARALGLPTRGTTNPNRLRRVDRWLVGTPSVASVLADA
ncbi:MAG TPA: class I SAM-dependent methyltransferase, partial [Pseudonocardiaceae bacterium]|nr:class I SAM-dependent methyltransferase [Pseudonocardiaceae bacterium]